MSHIEPQDHKVDALLYIFLSLFVLGAPNFCVHTPSGCMCRYNLLREESEGWAKAVDVLNQEQPQQLSPQALQQMVRPCQPLIRPCQPLVRPPMGQIREKQGQG